MEAGHREEPHQPRQSLRGDRGGRADTFQVRRQHCCSIVVNDIPLIFRTPYPVPVFHTPIIHTPYFIPPHLSVHTPYPILHTPFSILVFRFCVSVQRENFPLDPTVSPPLPAHTLTLHPPLTIVNLLPCDMLQVFLNPSSLYKHICKGKEIAVYSVSESSSCFSLTADVHVYFKILTFTCAGTYRGTG